MILDEIFLDSVYLDSLERLAIKENWITTDFDSNYFFSIERESNRIQYKSKVLLFITLFNNLDSSFSSYNFDRFKDEGIIRKNNPLISYDKFDPLYDDFFDGTTEDKILMLDAHKNTYNILKVSKQKTINHIINISSKGFYIHNNITRVNKDDLSLEYEHALNCILTTNDHLEISLDKPHLDMFLTNLLIIWSSIRTGIFQSLKNKSSLATPLTIQQKTQYRNTENLINEVYYLVQTQLSDEIRFLPSPRSIDEALELRNKKEMLRFREVLSEWLITLQNNNSQIEAKVRKDLKTANYSLKTIKRWREYESSPFNFWLNAIGGIFQFFLIFYLL